MTDHNHPVTNEALAQQVYHSSPEQLVDDLPVLFNPNTGYASSLIHFPNSRQARVLANILVLIEGSIGQTEEGSHLRTSLGKQAAGLAIKAFTAYEDKDIEPKITLADQAGQLAELIASPDEKIYTLLDVTSNIVQTAGNQPFAFAGLVDRCLDEAANTALTHEDGLASRSFILTSVAEKSAGAVDWLTKADGDEPEKGLGLSLSLAMSERTVQLYTEALGIIKKQEVAGTRVHEQSRVAISMVKAAAQIYGTNQELGRQLINMATEEIANVILAYRQDRDLAKLQDGQKCFKLADFGKQMAAAIGHSYDPEAAEAAEINPVIDKVFDVFDEANDYAGDVSRRSFWDRLFKDKDRLSNSYDYAGQAAISLLDLDYDSALGLLGVSYDLAKTQEENDEGWRGDKAETNDVLDRIRNLAKNQASVERGFAMFWFADDLVVNYASEGENIGFEQGHNYHGVLDYLYNAEPQEVALDELRPEFVEKIIKFAGANVTYFVPLRILRNRYMANPSLIAEADKLLADLSARRAI
ncbi:MAG TPA: hypothetical protein VII55_01425 [Candidatus Saccharimonadales bacterium]